MQNLPTINKNAFIPSFLLACGYCIGLFLLQFFLHRSELVSFTPGDTTLLKWDASIYKDIAENGYTYLDEQFNNTGQTCLFSWLWRILHVGITGISLVNILLFSIGFGILGALLKPQTENALLWLTTPSLYIMAVPYTEALFFLLTTLFILGIEKKLKWLVWICLILMSLTRATTIFIFPAAILMTLLKSDKTKFWPSILRAGINYALPIIIGIGSFVIVQYQAVHIWFASFRQQQKYLGHEWQLPTLPFANFYGGNHVLWLTGFAFLACLVAMLMLLGYIIRWLRKGNIAINHLMVLSCGYLAFSLISIVFCSPTWATNTTNLLGMHRYSLSTPFFFVFLHSMSAKRPTAKAFGMLFIIANLAWLTFGSYIHIQHLVFWNAVTAMAFLYLGYTSEKAKWVRPALIALNFLLQVLLFQQYLAGSYPD